MLRDKLSVLRSEFYKADAKRERESGDLRSQLIVHKEKLKNYADIEDELDKAIEGYAGGDSGTPEGGLFM